MNTSKTKTSKRSIVGQVGGILVASTLLLGLQLGVLPAPSVEAATENTNILSLAFGVPNEGKSKTVPSRGVPRNWNPPTERNCYPQPDKVEIDPETKEEIRTPVPDDCRWEKKIGSTGETFESGVATWPKNQVLSETVPDFVTFLRTAPNNLPDEGDYFGRGFGNGTAPCLWTPIRQYNFAGLNGYQLPNGVHWGVTNYWEVDGNRNVVLVRKSVEYGGCIFEPIKQYVNTCQIEAGPVHAVGPTGKGLPVEIAPNKYDPDTVSQRVGLADSTSGKTVVYSPLGVKLKNGSFDGLSSKQKAAMVRDCAKENTGPNNIYAQFDFKPMHPGNYTIEGPGARVMCAYSQFMDIIEFNGCKPLERRNFDNKGWLDCKGGLNPGHNNTYDFSCRKADISCFEEGGEIICRGGPAGVNFRLPPSLEADTVYCVFDEAIVNEPNGVTLKHQTTPIHVGATGEKWVIDWGNVEVRNIPGTETNRWTEWHIGDDSSPGKKDLDASHSSQPFKGKFEGKRVLAWENKKGGVALPNRWATKVDLNWYAAGENNKNFTIYQNRKFTWIKTINMTNWNGSKRSIEVLVPQNCKTQTFTFNLLRNRNTGGMPSR